MRATLFATALLLAGTSLAFLPSASAGHCAPEPLVDEVVCIVNHTVYDDVLCYYNTAPARWIGTCLPDIGPD